MDTILHKLNIIPLNLALSLNIWTKKLIYKMPIEIGRNLMHYGLKLSLLLCIAV
jgi:hypothetical protein